MRLKTLCFLFLCSVAFGQASKVVAVSDSSFVNLADYSREFDYDMKYATADNFLKSDVYGCAQCWLRLATVKALVAANDKFMHNGFHIRIYDCYRPLDIQKAMWKIVSDPKYVADPATGSIHNRGGAVDISLVDGDGNAVDMGTSFDHFGPEAAHAYRNLPRTVRGNRKFLKKIMKKSGFESFDSEWWHYNLKGARELPLSNFKWKCR